MDKQEQTATVSVEAAARRMGLTVELTRQALVEGKLPAGFSVKMPGGKTRYVVFERRLEMYLAGEL